MPGTLVLGIFFPTHNTERTFLPGQYCTNCPTAPNLTLKKGVLKKPFRELSKDIP